MSFKLDWNNIFREAVIIGLEEGVPEFGGLLAKITGALWPEDETNPLDEVVDLINRMMQKVLDLEAMINLKNDVDTLRDALKATQNTIDNTEYYDKLRNAIDTCANMRHSFVDDNQKKPWNTLRYLVPYGTIRLTLLREEYLRYADLYKTTDGTPTPDKPQQKLDELLAEIAIFNGMVHDGRRQALLHRRGCVQINLKDSFEDGKYWEVSDSFPPGYSRRSNLHSGHQDYINRIWDIDVDYNGWLASFDAYLDTSRFWDQFDPSKKYKPIPGPYFWQNRLGANLDTKRYGGDEEKWDYGTYFNDANSYISYGEITQMEVHFDSSKGLTGIQVWYGGVSGGLHGFTSSGVASLTLNVGPKHSYITQVGGNADSRVSKFWFRTNLDVLASPDNASVNATGGGANVADNFTYEVSSPDSPEASRLAYVSGFASSEGIGQLRFCWEKTVSDVRHAWNQNEANPRGNRTPRAIKAQKKPKDDGPTVVLPPTGTGIDPP